MVGRTSDRKERPVLGLALRRGRPLLRRSQRLALRDAERMRTRKVDADTAPAQAQAARTWVSGVDDDANPCSRTAPCKTFAGAISKNLLD